MKKRKEKKRKTLKFEALTAYIIRSLIFEKSESTVGRPNLINIYQRSIFLRWGRKKRKKKKRFNQKNTYTRIQRIYLEKERDKQKVNQRERSMDIFVDRTLYRNNSSEDGQNACELFRAKSRRRRRRRRTLVYPELFRSSNERLEYLPAQRKLAAIRASPFPRRISLSSCTSMHHSILSGFEYLYRWNRTGFA